MDARTRLVDLVPRGNRAYTCLLAGGFAIVAVLEILYAIMPLLSPHTTDGRVAAFDLDAEGSLAVWVSSVTLLAAAVVSLLIYVVRIDAAGRRRRLWLWAAACWTIMSIDECSSLHEAFKELMSHATGERIYHDGTIWWVGAYFSVLSVTGLLLLWEMRSCREASVAFLSVAACYATAVLAELGVILPKNRAGVSLEEGCEMLGNFCLLTAMALFVRRAAEPYRQTEPVIMQSTFERESRRETDAVLNSRIDFAVLQARNEREVSER